MSKTILLTGATDGIGLETAKALAADGHKLLLHGRNMSKLEDTKQMLLRIKADVEIELLCADLSDLDAVHKMADTILSEGQKLDIIINNAGVFVMNDNDVIAKNGLDARFVINIIAPYILTKKLLPLLNTDGRVVNLSSAAQGTIDLNSFDKYKKLSHNDAYAQSKLAIVMWSMDLAEAYPNGPSFISVNPKSFLGSKLVKKAYGRQGYDLKIGADILCRAALSDEFANASGKYYDNDYGVFAEPHPYALNEKNRAMLMEKLERFL